MTLLKKFTIGLMATVFCSMSFAANPVVDIKQWKTENGAKVLHVYLPEIAMVDINVAFAAGSARDGNNYGIAHLTNTMLNEGTVKHSASEVAESFEKVGAKFYTQASVDNATLALRSLTDNKYLQPALTNFAEVLAQPDFPKNNFSRVKNETLTAIQESKQNPSQVASETFYELVYGDYPYGHPVIGTESNIKEIELNDIKKFYQKYYVAANAVIVIVGNIKRDQAELIANQIMTDLPKGKKAEALPPPGYQAGPRHKQIQFPSSQTYIRIGNLGTKYNDPINFALDVGNYILGGKPLVSRLFTEVREKNGLTYNIHSGFNLFQETGTFAIGLQTRNDTTNKAIDLSNQVLDEFMKSGPSKAEVDKAKQGIIDSFPNNISNNSKILSAVTTIGFYDLPLDYLDTYRDNISAVTVKDINQAFNKVINPKQLITVTVGASNKTQTREAIVTAENKMLPVSW